MPLEFDHYVLETLMPDLVGHDRHPTAFLVYLFLSAECQRQGVAEIASSLSEIAEGTGASRRSVQSAVARLESRQLISVRRTSATDTLNYAVQTPWRNRGKAS